MKLEAMPLNITRCTFFAIFLFAKILISRISTYVKGVRSADNHSILQLYVSVCFPGIK